MKQSIFTIVSNVALTETVYKMVLSGDTSAVTNCGQFVDLRLPEKYLRRPISVCDYDGQTLWNTRPLHGNLNQPRFLSYRRTMFRCS